MQANINQMRVYQTDNRITLPAWPLDPKAKTYAELYAEPEPTVPVVYAPQAEIKEAGEALYFLFRHEQVPFVMNKLMKAIGRSTGYYTQLTSRAAQMTLADLEEMAGKFGLTLEEFKGVEKNLDTYLGRIKVAILENGLEPSETGRKSW